LFSETQERLLPFDAKAADRYGELVAAREGAGRRISVADAIIASIAWTHRAALATRNVHDFDNCGIQVVNPYAF
jgi:toxin FitB